MRRFLAPAAVLLAGLGATTWTVSQRPAAGTFAAHVAELSEPGGYFDTDNLISNERSFLHVLPELEATGVRGGAYLGVGPDQNFSYIAEIKPSVAFIVDIRRDNLLLHLLFKALFAMADTRESYLSQLLGRPPPPAGRGAASVETLVEHFARVGPSPPDRLTALRTQVQQRLQTFGVPLSAADLATIGRFHQRFIDDGVRLQFNSTGRAPQPGYPTYGDLLTERDRDGRQRSFVATAAAFDVVKALQAKDRIIPVVGDLAGTTAVAAIGKWLTARNERVSAFYTSNVEFYLFRSGTFSQFVANAARLPRQPRAVIVRSVFGGVGLREPGYNSASLVQPLGDLIDGYARGRFRQYFDLYAGR